MPVDRAQVYRDGIAMENDPLVSIIHFLEKRDEVSKMENEELNELLRSLREEYREYVEQKQKAFENNRDTYSASFRHYR